MIRSAQIQDANRLTIIMRASKAYWAYSDEQLKAWEKELTITERHIQEYKVFSYWEFNQITAFYSLKLTKGNRGWLENLFVLPKHIGSGQGSLLLEHAITLAIQNHCELLELESDPNAAAFYLKKGFQQIGQTPTSIPGRFMPVFQKRLPF